METNLNLSDALKIVQQNKLTDLDLFTVLKLVGVTFNNRKYKQLEQVAQEIILRLLEKRDSLKKYEALLDSLVRQAGLFPYLETEKLGLSDYIAYEFHRPIGMEKDNIVFHRAQAEIYRELLAGKNVILSAPTSFGKSLIIDAMIATGRFKDIAIVVPTIALIDETRRRLSKFSDSYKLITHASQEPGDKSIFVLTQERVVDFLEVGNIDFFVIDEFYKINPTEKSDDRSIVLNQAFYKLLQSNAQFYLLGPNVDRISGISGQIEFSFIKTDYKTVVSEFHRINVSEEKAMSKLMALVASLDEPTLIYCKSPNSVNKVVQEMLQKDMYGDVPELADATKWLKLNYHPKWLLAEALAKGIGVHHGKIPRAISQYSVRQFNAGLIKVLVCTSTLIE